MKPRLVTLILALLLAGVTAQESWAQKSVQDFGVLPTNSPSVNRDGNTIQK